MTDRWCVGCRHAGPPSDFLAATARATGVVRHVHRPQSAKPDCFGRGVGPASRDAIALAEPPSRGMRIQP